MSADMDPDLTTAVLYQLEENGKKTDSLQKSIAILTQLLHKVVEDQGCAAIARRERGY